MKNIHVLPTDQPSRLHYSKVINPHGGLSYKLVFNDEFFRCNDGLSSGQRFIYITSPNADIKVGDWIIPIDEIAYKLKSKAEQLESDYKIILTTDPQLIADGVQAIDDKFIQWFVNNQSCEEVEVERLEDGQYVDRFADGSVVEGIYENYKIIIPKEESKQKTLKEENFTLMEKELIKEAKKVWKEFHPNPIEMALFGAKWKEEISYSEEEVKKIAFDFYYCMSKKMNVSENLISENATNLEEWFETIKK